MPHTYIVCYQRCAGTMLLTHTFLSDSVAEIEQIIHDLAPDNEEPIIHFITKVVKVERQT